MVVPKGCRVVINPPEFPGAIHRVDQRRNIVLGIVGAKEARRVPLTLRPPAAAGRSVVRRAGQCRTPPAASPDRCDEYPQIQRPAGLTAGSGNGSPAVSPVPLPPGSPDCGSSFPRPISLCASHSSAALRPITRRHSAYRPRGHRGRLRRKAVKADLGDHFPAAERGDIAASSSLLPYRAPIPVGPYSLWPEKA